MEPSSKRRRTEQGANNASTRDISPPSTKKHPDLHETGGEANLSVLNSSAAGKKSAHVAELEKTNAITLNVDPPLIPSPGEPFSFLSSPIHLIRVDGLPDASNIDCLSLSDLVGDPLIRECWAFNYLFDVDFLL